MISTYSFAIAVIFYNLALIAVWFLCRNKMFRAQYGTRLLLLMSVLTLLRLFTPVDHSFAYIIRSERLIPALQSVLEFPVLQNGISVGNAFFLIWGLGTCVYVIATAISLTRDWKRRSRYSRLHIDCVAELAEEMGIKCPVIVSDDVAVPHVTGVFRPGIYLPPLELSRSEWRFVLSHEYRHLQSHDLPVKLFYFLMAAIFWWNPISHAFVYQLDSLLELRCDTNMIRGLTALERTEYVGAVLKVAAQCKAMPRSKQALHSSLLDADEELRRRFEYIITYDRNAFRKRRIVLSVLVIIIFILSYFIIVQPGYYPSMDEIEGTHTVTESSAYILYDGESYTMYIGNQPFETVPEDMLDMDPYKYLPVIEGER